MGERYSAALEEVPESVRRALSSRYGFQSSDELRRVVNETLRNRSRNWAVGVASGVCVLGTTLFLYRRETKEAVATELSDVASRSLGDPRMQAQAQLVTIQTLQALLEHEETVQRSVAFISAVSEHEQTRAALIKLLVDALKSRPVIDEALELVLWVLNNDRARDNLVSTLLAALCSERFEEVASEWVVRWLARDDIRAAVADALHEASKQALQEPDLQAKTSEHMWGALRGLIMPTPRRRPILERRDSAGLKGEARAAAERPSVATPANQRTSQPAPLPAAPELTPQPAARPTSTAAPPALSATVTTQPARADVVVASSAMGPAKGGAVATPEVPPPTKAVHAALPETATEGALAASATPALVPHGLALAAGPPLPGALTTDSEPGKTSAESASSTGPSSLHVGAPSSAAAVTPAVDPSSLTTSAPSVINDSNARNTLDEVADAGTPQLDAEPRGHRHGGGPIAADPSTVETPPVPTPEIPAALPRASPHTHLDVESGEPPARDAAPSVPRSSQPHTADSAASARAVPSATSTLSAPQAAPASSSSIHTSAVSAS